MSNGRGLFFDGIPYSAADMVSYLGNICTDGVLMDGDGLKPVSLGGLNVRILKGTAYLKGYCYVLDEFGCDFTIRSGTRTDLIVVQLDLTNKTLQLVLKESQEEPSENEVGIAKLAVDGELVTITDIRERALFKLPLASNAARIVCGSYAGTGGYESSSGGYYGSVSLAFEECPKMLFISGGGYVGIALFSQATRKASCLGFNSGNSANYGSFGMTYDGAFVSWNTTSYDAELCLNRQGITYNYCTIY